MGLKLPFSCVVLCCPLFWEFMDVRLCRGVCQLRKNDDSAASMGLSCDLCTCCCTYMCVGVRGRRGTLFFESSGQKKR